MVNLDKREPNGQPCEFSESQDILGQPEATSEDAQEIREPMAKRVLRDFKRFVESHPADSDDELSPDMSEADFLAQMFEGGPSVDVWTIYQDFYQSDVDSLKYKAGPESKKVAEKYTADIVTLLTSRKYKSNPNIKFLEDPDEKWVQHTVNGGFNPEEVENMGRFYLNLKPEEAVGFYRKALEESAQRGIHLDMKIVRKAKLKCLNQRDKMVIYFDEKEEQQVLEMLQELYGNNEAAFDNTGVPQGSVERIKGFLEKPNSTEIILRKDGELIGCNFSFEVSEKEMRKEVPYANFFTRPGERVFLLKALNIKLKYRGQGFGKMLMEQTMADTRQKGATKLILSTPEKDPIPARRLYEKLGFKEVAPNQDPHSFYMVYECEQEEDKN